VKSIVLLKNEEKILPIDEKVRSICIVGPNAASLEALLGNYHGLNSGLITLIEGIVGRIPEGVRIEYRYGCHWTQPSANPLNWSVNEAAWADLTIACMGLSPLLEGEEGDAYFSAETGDRAEIELPEVQVEYLKRLVTAGAKVVLVLCGGSPVALGELAGQLPAILWIGYPGQEGGRALADVLFGQAVPSGKLPMTFPESTAQLPPFDDYQMRGRTYRYATAEPLYPFGFGLSYTQFAYRDLDLANGRLSAGQEVAVQVTVTNAGDREAEEVVQFYLSDLEASAEAPIQRLAGFRRVRLKPGESTMLGYTLTPEMMMLVDENGQRRLEPGAFRLTVGGCSPGSRGVALGAPQPVSTEFLLLADGGG
jgi:beta-glucosidase